MKECRCPNWVKAELLPLTLLLCVSLYDRNRGYRALYTHIHGHIWYLGQIAILRVGHSNLGQSEYESHSQRLVYTKCDYIAKLMSNFPRGKIKSFFGGYYCKLMDILKYSLYHSYAKLYKWLLLLHIYSWGSAQFLSDLWLPLIVTWAMLNGAHKQNVLPKQQHPYNSHYGNLDQVPPHSTANPSSIN